MNTNRLGGRYLHENGKVVIDAAVKNSRQLFNERDPAPFRERDLSDAFVAYVVSSAQEFPLKTPMKLRILVTDEIESSLDKQEIRAAIGSYFEYESELTRAKQKKRLRVARFFLAFGIAVLAVCLGMAHIIRSIDSSSPILHTVGEGFVIIGWVALWRPVESILYDWLPLREQTRYLRKVAAMDVEVICRA